MKKIKNCRICSSKKIRKVFDLGSQHYSGKFPKAKNLKITKTPLAISLCQNCKFVQLSHNFNNAYLYNKEYGYESGIIVQ